jgi:hypothetical protein
MKEKEISVKHKVETVDGVIVSERLVLNDESVPPNGIPQSISFHPSHVKALIKKLQRYDKI